MARRANKDTFVYELAGGTRVRRRVREGQLVSPLYEANEADVEEVPDEGAIFQIAAEPAKARKKRAPRKRGFEVPEVASEPAQNPDTQGSGRLPEEAGD
jgi:hypothetical protein